MEHELKLDINLKLSGCTTKNPLPVLSGPLESRKEVKRNVGFWITCLCYSASTNIVIKRKQNKPYECNICSDKFYYSADAGSYYTTYGLKEPFFMPEFYRIKIVSHLSHVYNS